MTRPDRPVLLRPDLIAVIAITVAGTTLFWQGLGAGLLSDDFDFYRRARDAGVLQALAWFVPNNYFWYRPIQDLAFWIEMQVFGYNPTAFHAVSLTGHIVSALLLYRLALKFGCTYVGAMAAGLLFVASVHAHEVVWWWADLHYAFGGPLIVGALLAWVTHRKVAAVLLTVAALLTDESSVLVVPLAIVAEFLLGDTSSLVDRVRQAVQRSLPLDGVVAGYFAFRFVVGRGIWGESAPCHSPSCVVSGLANYGVRLVIRPDRAYGIYESHKSLTLALGFLLVALLVTLAIKRWGTTPAIALGLAWAAGSVVFFVLALWPYASDRFLYYPDMGAALVLGGCVTEALRLWTAGSRPLRAATIAAGAVLVLWVGAGVHMLEVRASGWTAAGREATAIVNNIFLAEPNLPSNGLLDVQGVPDSSVNIFPPGNTGPYVFRNGLQSAVRLRYRREDIWIAYAGHPATGTYSVAVRLRVNPDESVTTIGP